MLCKVCSFLAKMLGAQIYIYAAFWDPEMEVAIKWKSLLLFSASLHRLTTAGTNRCGPQRILQAVLVPSLFKFSFPRLTVGVSLLSMQPHGFLVVIGEFKALRIRLASICPLPFCFNDYFLITWLWKKNTSYMERIFFIRGLMQCLGVATILFMELLLSSCTNLL